MARSKPRASLVAGKTYSIRYIDKGKLKVDGDLLAGYCDHQRQIISIENGQSPDNEADTLIHEVLHQLLCSFGAPLPEDLEETVAQTLGTAIFAHVRENPDFWKHITRIAWPRKPRTRREPQCPSSTKATLTPSSRSSP